MVIVFFCSQGFHPNCEHSNPEKYGPRGNLLNQKGGGLFGYTDLYGGYSGGLIKEGESIMDEAEEGPMMDAGIIGAAQKVEHYEIASYGTLRTYAETLGLEDAARWMKKKKRITF